MRNRWLGRLRAAAIGAALALLMRYPQDATEAVRAACRLWAVNVMPALFPFMVCSRLLASGVRSVSVTVPLAMLGGSPSGARLIAASDFPPETAQCLAALCATASPLFILGALSGGWRMLLAHWLGAAAAFLCVRAATPRGVPRPPPAPPPRIGMPDAIRDAALAMLTVCGCMALFGALSALIERLLPLPPGISAALACALEMAGGCARLRALGLPQPVLMAAQCAAISFGGLSVFMQNAAFLRPAGVRLCGQFAARGLHAAVSFALCLVLYQS